MNYRMRYGDHGDLEVECLFHVGSWVHIKAQEIAGLDSTEQLKSFVENRLTKTCCELRVPIGRVTVRFPEGAEL